MWARTGMNDFFSEEWAGLAHVFVIRRTVTKKGKQTIELAFGITTIPREKAHAKHLLECNRKHWHSENRLQYRRDVT